MGKVLIGIACLCLLGFFFIQQKEPSTTKINAPLVEKREVPEGWKEYTHDTYRFSLLHPTILVVSEHDEGDGASTIVFQNPDEGVGFQIFVVPYLEAQVSEERFHKDLPSGIRKDMENITIDGALGASFRSRNLLLGETHEVWFVNGGYLYEVTAPKPLDAWLATIMETWKFL